MDHESGYVDRPYHDAGQLARGRFRYRRRDTLGFADNTEELLRFRNRDTLRIHKHCWRTPHAVAASECNVGIYLRGGAWVGKTSLKLFGVKPGEAKGFTRYLAD